MQNNCFFQEKPFSITYIQCTSARYIKAKLQVRDGFVFLSTTNIDSYALVYIVWEEAASIYRQGIQNSEANFRAVEINKIVNNIEQWYNFQ